MLENKLAPSGGGTSAATAVTHGTDALARPSLLLWFAVVVVVAIVNAVILLNVKSARSTPPPHV